MVTEAHTSDVGTGVSPGSASTPLVSIRPIRSGSPSLQGGSGSGLGMEPHDIEARRLIAADFDELPRPITRAQAAGDARRWLARTEAGLELDEGLERLARRMSKRWGWSWARAYALLVRVRRRSA